MKIAGILELVCFRHEKMYLSFGRVFKFILGETCPYKLVNIFVIGNCQMIGLDHVHVCGIYGTHIYFIVIIQWFSIES